MKKIKLAGIIVLAIMFGFTLASCDSGGGAGGVTPDMVGIVVSSLPDQRVYGLDEPLISDGMVVSAVYSDGSRSPVTGYEVTGLPATMVGNVTIGVTYEGYKTSFTLSVIDKSKVQAAKPVISHSELGVLTDGGTYTVSRTSSITATTTTPGMEIWVNANTLVPSQNSDRAFRIDGEFGPFSLTPRANVQVTTSGIMTVRAVSCDGNNTYYDSDVTYIYFKFSD